MPLFGGRAIQTRFLLVLACFFLSGFAALLYETAWTRELAFLFGTSEIASAAVLAAYMGGLAAGAGAAVRIAPRMRRPLLVYGLLELAIALAALALPYGLRAVNVAYAALFGGAPAPPPDGAAAATAFQLAAAFLLLLVPTACMGATLPLLARQSVERDAQVGPRVGALYAVNTFGAIAGVVCAGFLLLPEIGLRKTVWVGVVINLVVVVIAAAAGRVPAGPVEASPSRPRAFSWVLPVMAASGAASFIYEVTWIRLLVHQLGGSVYAFSTMLASFLAGIALGGALASRLARQSVRAGLVFALAQLAVAALAMTAFLAADLIPDMALALGLSGQMDLVGNALLSACVLIPLATAIGATFPLAVRIAATSAEDAAAASARVMAWNTVGSIAGSLGAALLFLPSLGFVGTTQLAVSINLGLAVVTGLATRRRALAVVAAAAIALTLWLRPPSPMRLLSTGPLKSAMSESEPTLHFAVGRGATVRISRSGLGFRLFTNGLPEAMIGTRDAVPLGMYPTSWMGFLPALLRPETRSMLCIGLGGGTALETIPPSVERVDVIEIEEEVVEANRLMSEGRRVDPLADPRIHVYVNDARGALTLADTHYDAVIAQASHPWTAGAAHLYTREFFEMVRDRLEPGGIFIQWMGIPYVDEPLLRTLVATMRAVFPHTVIFNPGTAGGNAVLFIGSRKPLPVVENIERAIARAPALWAEYGITGLESALAAYALDEAGTERFARGAEINTDDHNVLAARSARAFGSALTVDAFYDLLGDDDPMYVRREAYTPFEMVRALLVNHHDARAERLAKSLPEGDRQIALGWVAYEKGSPRLAERRFRAGRSAGGDPEEAVRGLSLVSNTGAPAGAAGTSKTIADARMLAFEEDWPGLEALDADLAAVPPGDPAFGAAGRLRALLRIETGRPGEAMDVIDEVLRRGAPFEYTRAMVILRHRAAEARQRQDDPPAEPA